MLERLRQLTEDAATLNSKLILVVANAGGGKTDILSRFAESEGAPLINVGRELSRKLLSIPAMQRSVEVMPLLRDLIDQTDCEKCVVLDNIEILFEEDLHISPVDVLKKLAHARPLVAAWPGSFRDGRLTYARTGHREHCEAPIDGAVVFELN
ncbi:BREX-3 system P-loop-containing protein BrxF [Sphingopyxis macrogoltabida]|uniref:BREX-3 system P-loop-containing protein BrxF n=1 Tax=Sphingopyxis macrogoltabida TaxID=33050 RepID=UPI0006ECFF0F|nr:BREX-3 system P-loop-containing protein BrxF [Sphingopyxis macrogoltabida]ALJ12287.1 protein-S-isoprenylcysteine O-methyltransferase [Sphingopyxis macrogoltabida]